MTKLIRAEEIRAAYTAKVNEYLSKGMEISMRTMSGSQGELCKVDLTDGQSIYRIRLDRDYGHFNEDFFYGRYEAVVLIVEKFEESGRDVFDNWDTLWNGKGEQIELVTYYSVDDKNIFTDSLEELRRIMKIRDNRRAARRISNNVALDQKRLTMFYGLVRKQKGYSAITKKQIEKVTRTSNDCGVAYMVSFIRESKKPSVNIRFSVKRSV